MRWEAAAGGFRRLLNAFRESVATTLMQYQSGRGTRNVSHKRNLRLYNRIEELPLRLGVNRIAPLPRGLGKESLTLLSDGDEEVGCQLVTSYVIAEQLCINHYWLSGGIPQGRVGLQTKTVPM